MAVAVAATVFVTSVGPAFASDPFNGQGWQRSRPPAAVVYFKMPFHAGKDDEKVSYGLAVTAPAPRSYAASPTLIADMPKLLDLRFKGAAPETLLMSEQVAWSMNRGAMPEGQRHNLVGGPIGWLMNLALTGAAIYGVYTLLNKKCPAISTTTGGCVSTAN